MAGGFTLSGGEPLMQHRFVEALRGREVAWASTPTLDTNGYYGDQL